MKLSPSFCKSKVLTYKNWTCCVVLAQFHTSFHCPLDGHIMGINGWQFPEQLNPGMLVIMIDCGN